MPIVRLTLAFGLALVLGSSGMVFAQDRGSREAGRDRGAGLAGEQRTANASAPDRAGAGSGLDERYHQDHYYPSRGTTVGALPRGSVRVAYRGRDFYFHGGVWFRVIDDGYLIDEPPIGIVVPLLPPSYATLPYAGGPYYYANGVYYMSGPGGYVVVAPPQGADDSRSIAQPLPRSASNPLQPIVYPRNGQSAEQAVADRQTCNAWANAQPFSARDLSIYQRAIAACLEGRGYTVR